MVSYRTARKASKPTAFVPETILNESRPVAVAASRRLLLRCIHKSRREEGQLAAPKSIAKRTFVLKTFQLAEGRQRTILDGILRLFVDAQDALCQAVKDWPIPGKQNLKRVPVSLQAIRNQFAVIQMHFHFAIFVRVVILQCSQHFASLIFIFP